MTPERGRWRLLPRDSGVGWTPYVWLVYSVPFLVLPFAFPGSAAWRALNVAGYLAFLALYFRGYWLRGRALVPVMAGLVGLGAVFIARNPAANCFFIYAAAFAGRAGPPRVAARYLFGIVGFVMAEAALLSLPPWAWLPAAAVSLLVGGPNIHFFEMDRQRARLRRAQTEVEHMAKVAERERIARDMHDLLGHKLSVIVLKSELARKLSERDPARAAQEIREVEAVSRQALAEVRRAIHGYRSRGLPAELEAVRPALEAAGVALHVEMPALELPAGVEGVLALALREAVTNVARHSGARNCWVALSRDASTARLEVRDDGHASAAPDGAGLLGMRERARALGGDVVRESGGGTRLRVTLPIAGAAVAAAS